MVVSNALETLGNTPMVKIRLDGLEYVNLYAKLEYFNPTGSVKDRAACYILDKLLETKAINPDTTIVESSSGNFAISLAFFCKKHNLKFIPVVDPRILPTNEKILGKLCSEIVKVTEPDEEGNYLGSRIKKVKEMISGMQNCYWVNQYQNILNAEAYSNTIGSEICNKMAKVDYAFVSVSSGGTITGVSWKIKERFPDAKVVAVDTAGSTIFGGEAKKRFIPGMGSSMVPEILKAARIDSVQMVEELETLRMCNELLEKHFICAGGSSGSVIAAIKQYFEKHAPDRPVEVVTIFPDRGERYMDTIYNADWCSQHMQPRQTKTAAG